MHRYFVSCETKMISIGPKLFLGIYSTAWWIDARSSEFLKSESVSKAGLTGGHVGSVSPSKTLDVETVSQQSLNHQMHTHSSIFVAHRKCMSSNVNRSAEGRLKQRERKLLAPRRYQLEILEEAKKRNIIEYLETGTGKTLISVLLIKALSEELGREDAKKLTAFVVPLVPLVHQVGNRKTPVFSYSTP
jgi:hypothetical protein